MSRDLFWLTEQQFARIESHLPCDTRGKPRVDDRRVISGIVHVAEVGRAVGRCTRPTYDLGAQIFPTGLSDLRLVARKLTGTK